MGYTDQGYIPDSFETLLGQLIVSYNAQYGTTYTLETFTGTNIYKFAYPLIQKIMRLQNENAEIYAKLQDYIPFINQSINDPVLIYSGLIKAFNDAGFVVSIEPPSEAKKGILSICVNVDPLGEDYLVEKAVILQLLAGSTAAGMVFDGTEAGNVTLSNGQAFEFSYHLPSETPLILRATISISDNNRFPVDSVDEIKEKILANIESLYRLGLDFEPEKYLEINRDCPFAASLLLEWSADDGSTWNDNIIDANFDDLYTIAGSEAITVNLS